MTADWAPAFLGALVGSMGSYGVALVGRGTALETDANNLALALNDRVLEQAMTAGSAFGLLEASRPRTGWWTLIRARRVNRRIDAWMDQFVAADLKGAQRQRNAERDYPVDEDEGGED